MSCKFKITLQDSDSFSMLEVGDWATISFTDGSYLDGIMITEFLPEENAIVITSEIFRNRVEISLEKIQKIS